MDVMTAMAIAWSYAALYPSVKYLARSSLFGGPKTIVEAKKSDHIHIT